MGENSQQNSLETKDQTDLSNADQKNRSIGDHGRPVAAITGASSGFGAIFARRLAEQGYDLLLIARRDDLLRKKAVELADQFGVAIEIMKADLTDLTDLKRTEQRLERIKTLDYLVNSAGFGKTGAFPFVDVEKETQMIQLHCIAIMRLCRAALIPMTERRAGNIINLASVAGFVVGEACAEYTATKAYLLNFSRALQVDVRHFGIRIQALAPGFAKTEFYDTDTLKDTGITGRIFKTLWVSPEKVVTASLKSIRRKFFRGVVCIPTLRYKILAWLASEWLFAPLRIFFSAGSIR